MNRHPNPYHRIPSVLKRIGLPVSGDGIRFKTEWANQSAYTYPFMNGQGKAHRKKVSVLERTGPTTSGGGIRSKTDSANR